jgi:hypothetical protein
MSQDANIYRAAKLLISFYGENALINASLEADACLENGDLNGKIRWLRVVDVIKELQDVSPAIGIKPVH